MYVDDTCFAILGEDFGPLSTNPMGPNPGSTVATIESRCVLKSSLFQSYAFLRYFERLSINPRIKETKELQTLRDKTYVFCDTLSNFPQTLDRLEPSGAIWHHLGHLSASGAIWGHLGPSGATWDHPGFAPRAPKDTYFTILEAFLKTLSVCMARRSPATLFLRHFVRFFFRSKNISSVQLYNITQNAMLLKENAPRKNRPAVTLAQSPHFCDTS